MSELALGQIKGLSVNSNVVTVPSGHTLYAPGHVIQVVQTFKSDNYSTTSTSYVDVPGMSVSITPKNANSKILVIVNGTTGNGSVSYGTKVNLLRNSTPIAQSTTGTENQTLQLFTQDSYATNTVAIAYLDSPATTSSITYKIQIATFNSVSNSVWNRQPTGAAYPSSSSIIVMEIAA